MTTPRACPTDIAERTFLPKKRLSSATDSGECQSINSVRDS